MCGNQLSYIYIHGNVICGIDYSLKFLIDSNNAFAPHKALDSFSIIPLSPSFYPTLVDIGKTSCDIHPWDNGMMSMVQYSRVDKDLVIQFQSFFQRRLKNVSTCKFKILKNYPGVINDSAFRQLRWSPLCDIAIYFRDVHEYRRNSGRQRELSVFLRFFRACSLCVSIFQNVYIKKNSILLF